MRHVRSTGESDTTHITKIFLTGLLCTEEYFNVVYWMDTTISMGH
jgi:hypothetical protein